MTLSDESVAKLDEAIPFNPERPMHFDMDGNPITFGEWARLMEDSENRVVHSYVDKTLVSTVWIGLDHGTPLGPVPTQIFETMVFGYDARSLWRRIWDSVALRENTAGEYQWRYATKMQALRGHIIVLEAVANGRIDQLSWQDVTNPGEEENESG